jgi:hypothetical protein
MLHIFAIRFTDLRYLIVQLGDAFADGGFEWASGFFYNPLPPEVAARLLAGSGQL